MMRLRTVVVRATSSAVLILSGCTASADTLPDATAEVSPSSLAVGTSVLTTTATPTTTMPIPACGEFAQVIFDYRLLSTAKSLNHQLMLSSIFDNTTPATAADYFFEESLEYEEMVATLEALGEPPPEMIGPVFRMTKGLTQKAEAVLALSKATRVLSISGERDALDAIDEADFIIETAKWTTCPSWIPTPIDLGG